MEDIVRGLISYGFSEKQAKVYLAALKLGAAPGGTIARQSGVQRATCYSILHEFIQQGIVRKITRKGLMYFSVIEPEALLSALEEKADKIKSLIPSLKLLSESIGSKPQIQYLEGVEGLKQMFADFMTTDTNDAMRAILGNINYNNDKLMQTSDEYRKFRNKKGFLFKRIVTQHNANAETIQKEDKAFNRETCVIKEFPFDIKADINIYGPGKCAIIFFDDDHYAHVILIKSMEVYELMRGIFEYIWAKEGGAVKATKSKKPLSNNKKSRK